MNGHCPQATQNCPPRRWPLTPTAALPPSSLPTGICPLSTFEVGLEYDISRSASLIWTVRGSSHSVVIVPVSCPSLGPVGWELSLSFCPHHPAGYSRCSKIHPKWTIVQLRELPAKVERPGEGFSGVCVRQHGVISETHDARGNRTSSALVPASCLDGVSQGHEGASVRLPEVERQDRALGGIRMAEAGMGRCTDRPRALQGPPLWLQLSENMCM